MLQSESQQIQLLPYLEYYYDPIISYIFIGGVHNTGVRAKVSPVQFGNRLLRPSDTTNWPSTANTFYTEKYQDVLAPGWVRSESWIPIMSHSECSECSKRSTLYHLPRGTMNV